MASTITTGDITLSTTIERVARACHEANRVYCRSLGDDSQLPWEDAPEWARDSAIYGVSKIASGEITRPEQSHESWLAQKEAEGWRYGPVKDPEKKEHPCFVPYDQLPREQQLKDHLFFAIASALVGPRAT